MNIFLADLDRLTIQLVSCTTSSVFTFFRLSHTPVTGCHSTAGSCTFNVISKLEIRSWDCTQWFGMTTEIDTSSEKSCPMSDWKNTNVYCPNPRHDVSIYILDVGEICIKGPPRFALLFFTGPPQTTGVITPCNFFTSYRSSFSLSRSVQLAFFPSQSLHADASIQAQNASLTTLAHAAPRHATAVVRAVLSS